jgi:hypothetical protein
MTHLAAPVARPARTGLRRRLHRTFVVLATVVSLCGLALFVGSATSAGAAEAPVGLGTATSFAVLAGAGVTNTGPTVINGDLGTCPTPAVTNFPPGLVSGTIHANDSVACGAQDDLTIAYNSAAGRAPSVTFAGPTELGGTTLTPGVYTTPESFAITGTLTLDSAGDPNAVFIFQAGSTLITATDSHVLLINPGQSCNVFWQVASSATLGVDSTFVGTIMALTSIQAETNAVVDGRLLARNASTTLDSNTVTATACATTPPPTTTTTAGAGATTTTTAAGAGGATTTTTAAGAGGATTTTTAAAGGSTPTTVAALTAASLPQVDNGATTTTPTPTPTTGLGTTSNNQTTTTRPATTTTAVPRLPVTGAPLAAAVLVAVLLLCFGAAATSSAKR